VTRRVPGSRWRRDTESAFGAAGWLFAELAMVLVIIAIGSEKIDKSAQVEHSPPPITTTQATTPPSAPVPPSRPEGLSLRTTTFTMSVPANSYGVVETFRQRLLDTVGTNSRVGLILLFGVSRNPNQPIEGTQVSEQLKELIEPAGIPQLRSTVDIRAYLGDKSDGQPGDVTVELFLLTEPS
jgi:hypothetical protein